LIAFAVGALLGDAFLHLIPDVSENEEETDDHSKKQVLVNMTIIGGIFIFYLFEKILVSTGIGHSHSEI